MCNATSHMMMKYFFIYPCFASSCDVCDSLDHAVIMSPFNGFDVNMQLYLNMSRRVVSN